MLLREPKKESHRCAEVALDIRTYYAGQNQATHPNVIAFEEKWQGWQYWMAYTAYPYANGSEENPCIAVSNDLIHWEKPEGLINPIASCEETECDELKDTHLLYNSKTGCLEVWYLGRIRSTFAERGPLHCFRKTSKDGVHWSAYQIMFSYSDVNLMSQTVTYSEKLGGYQFWGFENDAADAALWYMFSEDGFHWSERQKCDVPQGRETGMWHGAVTNYAGGGYGTSFGLAQNRRLIRPFTMPPVPTDSIFRIRIS